MLEDAVHLRKQGKGWTVAIHENGRSSERSFAHEDFATSWAAGHGARLGVSVRRDDGDNDFFDAFSNWLDMENSGRRRQL